MRLCRQGYGSVDEDGTVVRSIAQILNDTLMVVYDWPLFYEWWRQEGRKYPEVQFLPAE